MKAPSLTSTLARLAAVLALTAGPAFLAPSVYGQATPTRSFTNFPSSLKSVIKHVIIIYTENHTFDGLYGFFPGANGLQGITSANQYTSSTSTQLANLIQPNTNGLGLFGSAAVNDSRFPTQMPNAPTDMSQYLTDNGYNGDLTHKFYLEQYQINYNNGLAMPNGGGISLDPKNAGGPPMSKYSAWSSNPGQVLCYNDEYSGGEGLLARQFVIADNFYHSAFGGSFLNHFWLVAARTPVWKASPSGTGAVAAPGSASVTLQDTSTSATNSANIWSLGNPSGQWWPAAGGANNGQTASTLNDNSLTPDPTLPTFSYSNSMQSLGTGDYWAVNTLYPLMGPAGGYSIVPATTPYLNTSTTQLGKYPSWTSGTTVTSVSAPISSTAVGARLPLQTFDTIGDRLNSASTPISWAWFSGGWNNAKNGTADYLFQFHHQPFAYFAKYALATAPVYPANGSTTAPTPGVDSQDPNSLPVGYGIGSANHLLDEDHDFYPMLKAGTLPAVSFVKPIGEDNGHPGYASIKRNQEWIANIVAKIEGSPEWASTVIFITYDEHGGKWDHVVPPSVDGWGPGTRVPFIVISPYAKRGFVDHNQYETVSVLSFIEGLYGLTPLNSRDANALPPTAAFPPNPALTPRARPGAR